MTWSCCSGTASKVGDHVTTTGDYQVGTAKVTSEHEAESTETAVGEDDSTNSTTETAALVAAAVPRSSVWNEAVDMLTGALLIYTFADLREMSRQGELPATPLADLEAPITMQRVIAAMQANKEQLDAKATVDHEGMEERLLALHELKEKEGSMLDMVLGMRNNKAETPVLTHFHDENASSEMVHGIVVNPTAQRITVIFRGSVTPQDFVTDAKCHQKQVDNPAAGLSEGAPAQVNVHTGFYYYLFCPDDESGKPRLELILENVKDLLHEHPTYRVYCTGHSLGGALSTLFGFYAAADDALVANGPVTVVSIASPLVGNLDFRQAFMALERSQRLQHLRIANKEDMVTLLPFAAPKATMFSPVLAAAYGAGNLYKHVGIGLKLKTVSELGDEKPFELWYAKDLSDEDGYEAEKQRAINAGKTLMSSLKHLVKADFAKVTDYHSCNEYETRLDTCKQYLTDSTIDDLYNDSAIVGAVLDPASGTAPAKKEKPERRTFLKKIRSV